MVLVCLVFRTPSAAAKEPVIGAAEIDYPPFSIVDAEGNASGFSVELLRTALAAMDREVTFRTGPWAEVRGWLERGEVQVLPLVGRTPEREAIFEFTVPYMSLHGAIVVRQDTMDIHGMEDLRGRRVAVMKGDNAEEFLRREERGINIRTTATFENALQELSEGRHDAVVTQRLVALRLIQKTGLTNLRIINKPIEGFRQDFCFAVKEGDRETLALLNEGLAIVTADGTYRHLHAKWFAALQLPPDNRIVVGGDHSYPPFEFLNKDGRPAGYTVDLTLAIAQEMGLNVEIRLGPWADILQALEKGEIDIVQGMFYSAERDRKFDFTQPHAVNHYVSMVRKGEGVPPATIDELAGKNIVVQRGDAIHGYLVEKGLGEQVVLVETQEDVLRELAGGKHDCAIAVRISSLYLIEKNGWDNLVLEKNPFVTMEYCYAALNNSKALLAQFSEGLKVLEHSGEYRRIYDKWLGVYTKQHPPLLVALQYSIRVLVPLLLLLLAAFLWSWTLRRQVAQRTRELHESVDKFKYVFESANVGKSLTLPTGEINVNEAFAGFLGYRRDELQGRTWQDLTPAGEIETVRKRLATLLEGGEDSARFEKRYLHKNGSTIWGDVSFRLRRDADGRPLYFVTTIVDITERKQAEEKIRYFSRIFEESRNEIYLFSTETLKFREVNRAALQNLGYSMAEFREMTPLDIKPEFSPETFAELVSPLRTGEQDKIVFETVYQRKDRSRYDVEVHLQTLHFEEESLFVAIILDITERRKLEEQLRQSQKMESVGRLAGGVAHDFNNMLSIILGYVEMAMEMTAADPLQEELRQIKDAARRSVDLTRQLLAFARKQTAAPKVLALNEIIADLLKMLGRLIGEDIDLVWHPGPDLWPVKMDPAQLDQILANLCVNTRDAIAGIGKVIIETSNITFDAAYCVEHRGFRPGNYVMLAVSDDGCGMDRDTLDKIFEPFFTTKGLGRGTGLGLATVYGIVKQNNGFINVYSEPDQGTTFRIYLPGYIGRTETERPGEMKEQALGGWETVLLVEDEQALLELGKRMLESLGYKVLATASPGEAARLAKEYPGKIHLVITDVIMPEMNGRELFGKLSPLQPDIKCLFMSGYTANVIAHHGVLDEDVYFIPKPFSKQDLAKKIRIVLNNRKPA